MAKFSPLKDSINLLVYRSHTHGIVVKLFIIFYIPYPVDRVLNDMLKKAGIEPFSIQRFFLTFKLD